MNKDVKNILVQLDAMAPTINSLVVVAFTTDGSMQILTKGQPADFALASLGLSAYVQNTLGLQQAKELPNAEGTPVTDITPKKK